MGKKKTTPTAGAPGLPAMRIGSRVRCTADGVEGRITWANAVAVKIKWDDGEEVTWKRDSLAGRPIEIRAGDRAATDDRQLDRAAVPAVAEAVAAEQPSAAEATALPVLEQQSAAPMARQQSAVPEPGAVAAAPPAPAPVARPAAPAAAAPVPAAGPAAARPQQQPKAAAAPGHKKRSALDAAAKVLAETAAAMTCMELIGLLALRGYWTSPGGRTPDATLHAAIIREITVKGAQSRFVKTAPGRFALRPAAPPPESPRQG